MPILSETIYTLKTIEDFSGRKSLLHQMNPLAKLLVTIAYIVTVSSYGRYEISAIMPMVAYPIFIFAVTALDVTFFLKRLACIIPFVLMMGIFNPMFDTRSLGMEWGFITYGWLAFVSMAIKGTLTVLAALLLAGTTGITDIASALHRLRVPKMFVLQIVLTYRYLALLMQEISRMMMAYSLRAVKSGRKTGVHYSAWGSLAGGLLIRTYDRAQRVYDAMLLRGFDGEYKFSVCTSQFRFSAMDYLYVFICTAFFILSRTMNISKLLGGVFA